MKSKGQRRIEDLEAQLQLYSSREARIQALVKAWRAAAVNIRERAELAEVDQQHAPAWYVAAELDDCAKQLEERLGLGGEVGEDAPPPPDQELNG